MARPPERRVGRVLALGVALPTLLLALGWGYATLRERELYRRAEVERLDDMLASFELGVTESLSELADREGQRPHYCGALLSRRCALADGSGGCSVVGARVMRASWAFQIDETLGTPLETEPRAVRKGAPA